MRWLTFSALIALAGLSALNWRAQLQTQRELDTLAAAIAERPAAPVPAPPAAPPAVPSPTPGAASKEPNRIPQTYIIEAPDLVTIEAVVKDPKTGTTTPLPDQPIAGSFHVRPDGTVGLGYWGSVSVDGLTPQQAVQSIREHLAKRRPEKLSVETLSVVVEVMAVNSKFYYVISDSAKNGGEQVMRLPCTGSETVLDAIAQFGGLQKVSGASIRVARKRPNGIYQMLPVDWDDITQRGVTATNYQLMTGDRLYVTHE